MGAAIEVERLSKSFGGRHPALDDVSVEIGAGEMVALIGPSGSGKSTLLRHLSGLALGERSGTPGRIRVLDRDVHVHEAVVRRLGLCQKHQSALILRWRLSPNHSQPLGARPIIFAVAAVTIG